jgi:hypothetical protein
MHKIRLIWLVFCIIISCLELNGMMGSKWFTCAGGQLPFIKNSLRRDYVRAKPQASKSNKLLKAALLTGGVGTTAYCLYEFYSKTPEKQVDFLVDKDGKIESYNYDIASALIKTNPQFMQLLLQKLLNSIETADVNLLEMVAQQSTEHAVLLVSTVLSRTNLSKVRPEIIERIMLYPDRWHYSAIEPFLVEALVKSLGSTRYAGKHINIVQLCTYMFKHASTKALQDRIIYAMATDLDLKILDGLAQKDKELKSQVVAVMLSHTPEILCPTGLELTFMRVTAPSIYQSLLLAGIQNLKKDYPELTISQIIDFINVCYGEPYIAKALIKAMQEDALVKARVILNLLAINSLNKTVRKDAQFLDTIAIEAPALYCQVIRDILNSIKQNDTPFNLFMLDVLYRSEEAKKIVAEYFEADPQFKSDLLSKIFKSPEAAGFLAIKLRDKQEEGWPFYKELTVYTIDYIKEKVLLNENQKVQDIFRYLFFYSNHSDDTFIEFFSLLEKKLDKDTLFEGALVQMLLNKQNYSMFKNASPRLYKAMISAVLGKIPGFSECLGENKQHESFMACFMDISLDTKDPKECTPSQAHVRISKSKKEFVDLQRIIFHPDLCNMIERAHALERKLVANNYYVFFHAQRASLGFYGDIYTDLVRVLKPNGINVPQDYLFVRYIDYASIGKVTTGYKKYSKGRTKEKFDRSTNFLFLNAFLAGNCASKGACTLDYLLENRSIRTPLQASLKSVFKALELQDTYAKYKQELEELEKSYNELTADYGRLLQIAIPAHLVDEIVYLSAPGGYPITLTTENGTAYSSPSMLLDDIKQDPELLEQRVAMYEQGSESAWPVYRPIDNVEFCLVLPDIALNPASGIKIIAHDVPAYAPDGSAKKVAYETYLTEKRALIDKIIQNL